MSISVGAAENGFSFIRANQSAAAEGQRPCVAVKHNAALTVPCEPHASGGSLDQRRGITATQVITEGCEIFSESPIVVEQNNANRSIVPRPCAFCCSPHMCDPVELITRAFLELTLPSGFPFPPELPNTPTLGRTLSADPKKFFPPEMYEYAMLMKSQREEVESLLNMKLAAPMTLFPQDSLLQTSWQQVVRRVWMRFASHLNSTRSACNNFPCTGCGGESTYCSDECRLKDAEASHSVLCCRSQPSPNNSSLVAVAAERLRRFMITEASPLETVNLAFKLIIELADTKSLQAAPGSPGEAIDSRAVEFLNFFSHGPLPEVMRRREGADDDDEEISKLDEQIKEAHGVVKDALSVRPDRSMGGLLGDPQYFSNLLGMLDMNCVDVEIRSPLNFMLQSRTKTDAAQYLLKNEISKEELVLIQEIAQLYLEEKQSRVTSEEGQEATDITQQEDIWPNFHGSALYPKLSLVNHSCNPNTKVKFGANFRLQLLATRHIQAGEEISFSYLSEEDLELADEDRKENIKAAFGFDCVCPRCVAT